METFDIFSAIAEPTRREIIELLARNGQMPASAIYRKFDMSAPAVSQHLKVLRQAAVVKVQKQAQQRIYYINPESITALEEWAKKLRVMWNKRFDRLDEVLKTLQISKNTYGK